MKKVVSAFVIGLLAIGGFTFPTFSPSLAQTGQITASNTEVFNLNDLLTRRGKITVGTNGVSTIEFDEKILEYVPGNADLLHEPTISKANPNMLYLKAKEANGSSTLDIVLASGVKAQFQFLIDSKMRDGKRYVVRSEPVPATQQTVVVPATPASVAASNGTATANRVTAPDWLVFNVSSLMSGETISVNYVLTNKGSKSIFVDTAKLIISSGEEKISNTVIRQTNIGGNSILQPQAVQIGSIVFSKASFTSIKLTWVLQESGSKTTIYVLDRTVDVSPAARKPNSKPASSATAPKPITQPTVAITPKPVVQPIVAVTPVIPTMASVAINNAAAPTVPAVNQTPVQTGVVAVAPSQPPVPALILMGGKLETASNEVISNPYVYFGTRTVGEKLEVSIDLLNMTETNYEIDLRRIRIFIVDEQRQIVACFAIKNAKMVTLEPNVSQVFDAFFPILPTSKWINVIVQIPTSAGIIHRTSQIWNTMPI
jgi:hypothetical protein